MTRYLSKLLPRELRNWISIHWPVVVIIPMAVIVIVFLFWFFDRTTGSNLSANVPAELVGVAVSAVVTVFIVERALRLAEERRRGPLVKSALYVIRAHCSHLMWPFVWKCNPDVPRPEGKTGPEAARQRLQEAVTGHDCFTHLQPAERQDLFDEVSQSNCVLQDERRQHAPLLLKYPDLYRYLVDVDGAIREWSAYRHLDAPADDENPVICRVASIFLQLDSSLRSIPDY
jgi:hypothetical protein